MTGKNGHVDGAVAQATLIEFLRNFYNQQNAEINLFKPRGVYPYV